MPKGGALHFKLSRLALQPHQQRPIPNMPDGDWVVMTISDSGEGIPTELISHIFEPFFTTKEVGKGTGLGLAQVDGIIKQHHSFIDVQSWPGEGTTFTLYFPALSSLKPLSQLATQASDHLHGYGQTILLVEDSRSVLEINRKMLEGLGYQVLIATNGQEALGIYEQHRAEIELVITDMTMPKMSGIALSQALQAKNPRLKIIILTGYPLQPEMTTLFDPSVVTWLQKPLKMDQLAQVVNRSLQL
jgi:CheY-like chemotaxis protein